MLAEKSQGDQLLWQAGPQWPRHAPLLFPIVGRLKNDELRHRGEVYPMNQHGFARDHRFDWVSREASVCKLILTDNDATRASYPFAFRLGVTYRVEGAALEVEFEITNSGEEMLPASLGGHPAFNWPLLAGSSKEAYALTFSDDEPAPIRRLKGGLMRPQPEPTAIRGKTLSLSEALFEDDAVILEQLASRQVRYAADRGPSIEMSWHGFRELGVWSKPGGAPFLCIEPWRGFASPSEFDGEFSGKPGLMQIPAGESRSLGYRIRLAS